MIENMDEGSSPQDYDWGEGFLFTDDRKGGNYKRMNRAGRRRLAFSAAICRGEV